MKTFELKHLGKIVVVRVDDDDYDLISQYSWGIQESYSNKLYAYTYKLGYKDGRRVSMHRMIASAVGWNVAYLLHKNDDTLDNRKTNLIRLSGTEMRGMGRKKMKAKSRYKGVTFSMRSGPSQWVSRITYKGVSRYLGAFVDERDAAIAYDHAAEELYGDVAMTNTRMDLL